MAKHYAPSDHKTVQKKKPEQKRRLPTFRFSTLPKLMETKKRPLPKKTYPRVFSVGEMLLLLGATVLFIVSIVFRFPPLIETALLALCAVLALLPPLFQNVLKIFSRRLPDEDILITIGVIAAFCIGEQVGGAIAAVLYRLAQILEAYAVERGGAGMDLVRDKLPEKARVLFGDQTQELMPEIVEPGQVVLVENGEMIPLDGVILSGITEVDRSALTGNDSPVTCGVGDEVFSGSVNCGGPIRVQVKRSFADSAAASLLHDVEASARYKTTPERLTEKISALLGPVVGVLAVLIAVIPSLIGGNWSRWLRCAVIFLLTASPSALAISIPLSCFGAEMSGILHGILSKGHDCFEVLASVKTMVFGKTGTITEGRFEITGIEANGVRQEDLVAVAAAAESYSHHPIAMLLKHAAGWTPSVADGVMEVQEIPGRGISAFIEGRHVYVGNAALLQEHGVSYNVPARAGAAIHVAVENRYWGHILISDKTREGAFDALEALRSQGVDQLVMLTGDVPSASRQLASSLGFDLLRTELTAEGKVSAIQYLISGKGNGTSVGFVGDGINDASMLECADVGLAIDALHAWNEADAADILLLDDDIESLPRAMRIARTLKRILWENFGGLLGMKLLVLLLALCDVIPLGLAALLLTASSALALLNSLRAFGLK